MNQPKQVLYSPVNVDDADFADFTEVKSEEQIDWEKFRDEMRESNEYAKITIYRQPTDSLGQVKTKKLTYLFDVGMDEYQYSQLCARLRDEYGSGTYRIQGRDSGGVLRFNRGVTIEAPKLETEGGEKQTIPHIIAEMRQTMNEQQAYMAEFMRGPAHNLDPMDQLTKMAAAFGTIFGAMGIQQSQPKTLLEQLTEYKMMRELFGGDSQETGDGNLLGLLTATVNSFGPALGAAIAGGQDSGAIPASGPVQPRLPNPAPEPEPEQNEMLGQLAAMKPQIDFLVMQAEGGANPADVVDALMPNIPDDSLESIETFLSREDYLQISAQVNPRVNEFTEWFVAWRGAMLNALAQILDDGSDVIEPDEQKELTGGEGGAQNPDAVTGDVTDPSISASEPQTKDNGDTPGDT